MGNVFAAYHPAINFMFYICAIVFGMIFNHPAFLIAFLLCGFIFMWSARGAEVWRFTFSIIPVFIVLCAVNPLFNSLGNTVLFRYFGRAFTLEALYYGIAIAAMFCGMLYWIWGYTDSMTSDRFLYLFGRMAPSAALLLTIVLRFIPNYTRRAEKIDIARKCVGKGVSGSGLKEGLRNASSVMSALAGSALEDGIVAADSMRSRGFGTCRRTSASDYRFTLRDTCMSAVIILLASAVAVCSAMGGTRAAYIPEYDCVSLSDPYCLAGLVAYILFLLIPAAVNIAEEIQWRVLRSEI